MLLFAHYVDRSPIHGLGVFTSDPIKKGTLIWCFNPVFDRKIPLHEVSTFPSHVQNWVRRHSEFFPVEEVYVISCDGDLFMNHSFDPNLYSDGHEGHALRDISAGEEITCDYRYCRVLDFDFGKTALTGQEAEGAPA